VISLGTCHRHVTGHTKNEYKEQVKSRGTSKNFHLNLFTCERGHVPRDSQGNSQVKLFF